MASNKQEIDRLTQELQQACREKIQAAEYGLAVLEEKQQLQDKYDSLLVNNEQRKQEIHHLKSVSIFCCLLVFKLVSFTLRNHFNDLLIKHQYS